MENRTEY